MSEPSSEHTNPADWRAEFAYTVGVQAFIYGFPYIYNAQLRHDWVTKKRTPTAHLFDGSVHRCCGVAGPTVFQYRAMSEFPFAASLSFD